MQRVLAKILFSLALTFLLACLTCPQARGDVGIVLNESLDTSVDRISGTGHSAVYFSRICPESPVRLRLCRPDENGSVMSNYINGFTRNCATFTKRVINTYFPHAASADHINDFGMTTPKAIARSFAHYGVRNPELNFRVLHFAQVPGTIKPSNEVRSGTEQLYHSKKLLIPMLIFADYELPAVAASYLLTGRFNPEREFEKHPAEEANNPDARRPEEAHGKELAHVIGTSEEWKRYGKELNSLLEERVPTEIIAEQRDVQHLFKHLNKVGTPRVDVDGALWMEIRGKEQTFEVGLSANNILGQNSNTQLAYSLLLWRAHGVLKSPKHGRG